MKKKKNTDDPSGEFITYMRTWTGTPRHHKSKKVRRVVMERGITSWEKMEEAIRENARKNKLAMEALKKATVAAAKEGGTSCGWYAGRCRVGSGSSDC